MPDTQPHAASVSTSGTVSDPAPDRPAEKRRLGMTAATAMVVANMIGFGVFMSTGFMVPGLQAEPILVNWMLGGLLALCGAAAYAELGTMMPRVGGEYIYLSKAYHPAVGFLSGWVSLFGP